MRCALRFALAVLAVLLSLLFPRPAHGMVVVAPLRNDPPNVGILFRPSDVGVAVSVVDARPDRDFLAAAIIGPGAEKDSGIFLGYANETTDDLARYLEVAARDAVGVLGMRADGGHALELTVREFVVDLYRLSGFSPMNCIGYGTIDAVLKAPDGTILRERTFRPAFYEHRTPTGSMKEVATHALSRIFEQAAWQVTAVTLIDAFAPEPDPAQVATVLDAMDDYEDEVPARQAIFWLGISGISSPEVRDGLMAVFRSHEGQKVHQAAVEALGLLGVQEARPEIEAVLAGEIRLGEWDLEDNEQVWYLLHALALLGESDLASRIPTTEMRMRSKVDDLVRFHATGAPPEASEATLRKLDKNRQKLEKKRD